MMEVNRKKGREGGREGEMQAWRDDREDRPW